MLEDDDLDAAGPAALTAPACVLLRKPE